MVEYDQDGTTLTPRVRFAPSPTGYLHVGGARTALFNWLFARHEGGVLVLRIEDTDRERSQPELTEAIVDGLTWLGLDWDEGPAHQADHLERHRGGAARLVEAGAAYPCFCSADRLDALRREAKQAGVAAAYDGLCGKLPIDEAKRRIDAGEPHTIRFRVPPGETAWKDVVAGETRFKNEDIEDFVILRSDGTPTYNLAAVVDDMAMGITHVIRGADHISNTPKQIQLYQALGAEPPIFCHVPLILGPDGKRLSKRHGAAAIGEYEKAGYLPEAMDNFLALLGWSPGDDRELMSTRELIDRFSLQRINRKPAVFDHEKLLWLNGQHLSRYDSTKIAGWVAPHLIERGITTAAELESRSEWFQRVLDLLKSRAKRLTDLIDLARPFFGGTIEPEPAVAAKHWKDRGATVERLQRLRADLADPGPWEPEALEVQVRAIAEDMGVGAGALIHPLRVALTGAAASPGIFELMDLMGRELVLARIDEALQRLRSD